MRHVLAVLLSLFALPASAATGIFLEGETGAILDAQRVTLDGTNGTVTAFRSGASVVIQWDRAAGRSDPPFTPYRFQLAGIGGSNLALGEYQDARSLIANVPIFPLFDLNAGCNGESRTNFEVRELQFGSGGEVLKLAVDFVAYCGFSTRPLRGRLRFDSSLPLVSPAPAAKAGTDQRVAAGAAVSLDASASASSDGSMLTYAWRQISGKGVALQGATSARPGFVAPATTGEYEFLEFEVEVADGAGRTSTDRVIVTVTSLAPRNLLAYQTPPDHPNGQLDLTFELDPGSVQLRRNLRSGIYAGYTGDLRGPTGSFGGFSIDVSAPNASTIVAENYFPAYRTAFAPPGHSGLDYSLGVGCLNPISSYVVHEAVYDEFGRVERLAIDFDTDCIETTTAAGQLRINSVVPLRSRLPHANGGPDLVMFTGQVVVLDASLSSGGTSSISATSWRQVGGPAISLRPGSIDAEVIFDAPAFPPGGGELVFEVRVVNAAGFDDTDLVKVTVLGQNDPRSWAFLQVPPNQGTDFVTQMAGGSIFQSVNEGSFVTSRTSNIVGETLLLEHIAEARTSYYFVAPPGAGTADGASVPSGAPRPLRLHLERGA